MTASPQNAEQRVATPAEVLEFWFYGTSDDAPLSPSTIGKWCNYEGITLQVIAKRFLPTLAAAEDGALDEWKKTKEGSLALIIVLDVFTRYVMGFSKEGFRNDPKAQAVLKNAIAKGFDQQWSWLERLFGYLPYEHAENAEMQQQSLQYYTEIAQKAPKVLGPWVEGARSVAAVHASMIKHFGRFPQRNTLLGRQSTPLELSLLADSLAILDKANFSHKAK